MQIQNHNFRVERILEYIVASQNIFMLTTFINFINNEQLQTITQLALKGKRKEHFFRIIIAKLFLGKYLNRVDRSIFFLFYEEPDFQNIQKNTINSLAYNQYSFLEQNYHQYQKLLTAVQNQTKYLKEDQPQFQTIIQTLFYEPDLPLPKMKRETIGMYCESAFQQHLSMIKFKQQQFEQLWMQQPLLILKPLLQQQMETIINNHDHIIINDPNMRQKIERVRYRAYQINHFNWEQNTIASFKIHNLIVLLMAMCSELVDTFQVMLNNIEDPFMRFIEFQLRASIYRNIVLAIEEKFYFLLDCYSTFYMHSFHPPNSHPPLNFWRPALSLWIQRMKGFHSKNTKVYNYIIAKLRQQNLRIFLEQKIDKLPSFYNTLKSDIDLNTFSVVKKQIAYKQNDNKLEIQSFFQNNYEMYEVLAKDYLEYMVDISINQFSVHFCGHSEHCIKNYPLFREYSDNLINQAIFFYDYVKDKLYQILPKQIKLGIFRQVIKEDIQFLNDKIVKPVILKEILVKMNDWIRTQVEDMIEFAVFGQEGVNKYRIVIDFQQKDNLLNYFANKAKIDPDCPSNLWFQYNIQIDPNMQNQQIQIQKNNSQDSEMMEQHDIEEYNSQGEIDEEKQESQQKQYNSQSEIDEEQQESQQKEYNIQSEIDQEKQESKQKQ